MLAVAACTTEGPARNDDGLAPTGARNCRQRLAQLPCQPLDDPDLPEAALLLAGEGIRPWETVSPTWATLP